MQIRTAGELRGFLAEILVGIRDGTVECAQAHAISKVAAQINQSLAVEVNTALQLERMGKDHPIAGSMLIGYAGATELPAPVESSSEPEEWANSLVHCAPYLKTVKEIDDCIARSSARLEELMESRPDLHAKITEALTERRLELLPAGSDYEEIDPEFEPFAEDLELSGELEKLDGKLRDDLLWCDQCDMRVTPEDAAGCKSRYCSIKKTRAA